MKRHGINQIYTTDKGFDKVSTIKRTFEELKNEPEYNSFATKLKSRR
jgi:predicted nucleic acid-binding protein